MCFQIISTDSYLIYNAKIKSPIPRHKDLSNIFQNITKFEAIENYFRVLLTIYEFR